MRCWVRQIYSLVNSMNAFFVSVSEDLPRLQYSHLNFNAKETLPAKLAISVIDTELALATL